MAAGYPYAPSFDAPAEQARRRWSLDNLAFAGLLFAMAWAPWPLGSNRPWALGILAAVVWLSIVAALASRLMASAPAPRAAIWRDFMPFFGLGGFTVLVALQWVMGDATGTNLGTIDRHATQDYLVATLTYGGAFVLTWLCVRSGGRVWVVLAVIAGTGVVQACVAVLLYAAGERYEFLFTSFDQGSRASGTFPNPDHFAGYMELCMSAGIGLLLAQLGTGAQSGSGWRSALVGFLSFVLSGKMLLRLLLVVMVVGLVMSHSRMGNGAFFFALLLCGGIVAAASKSLRRPALWLVASMAVIDLFVIGQWVGFDRLVQRLEATPLVEPDAGTVFGSERLSRPREESLEQRMRVPVMALALVYDRPWFGHGGGTFATAFPAFKQPTERVISMHWDHAHNDYVQVAADVGLVGLLLWLSVGVASLWRAIRLLRDGKSAAGTAVAVAGLMAISCMGVHSLVDFNLHIVSNALTFSVLVALIWTAALPTPSQPVARARRKGT